MACKEIENYKSKFHLYTSFNWRLSLPQGESAIWFLLLHDPLSEFHPLFASQWHLFPGKVGYRCYYYYTKNNRKHRTFKEIILSTFSVFIVISSEESIFPALMSFAIFPSPQGWSEEISVTSNMSYQTIRRGPSHAWARISSIHNFLNIVRYRYQLCLCWLEDFLESSQHSRSQAWVKEECCVRFGEPA